MFVHCACWLDADRLVWKADVHHGRASTRPPRWIQKIFGNSTWRNYQCEMFLFLLLSLLTFECRQISVSDVTPSELLLGMDFVASGLGNVISPDGRRADLMVHVETDWTSNLNLGAVEILLEVCFAQNKLQL